MFTYNFDIKKYEGKKRYSKENAYRRACAISVP
jgi:hypothetical protein